MGRGFYHYYFHSSYNFWHSVFSWLNSMPCHYFMLFSSHWIRIQKIFNFPRNPFIPAWSLSKSLPCLLFQPGLKTFLVTSKQLWCHCYIYMYYMCSVFQPGLWVISMACLVIQPCLKKVWVVSQYNMPCNEEGIGSGDTRIVPSTLVLEEYSKKFGSDGQVMSTQVETKGVLIVYAHLFLWVTTLYSTTENTKRWCGKGFLGVRLVRCVPLK